MSACNRNPPNESPYLIDAATVPAPKFKAFEVAILHYESDAGEVSNQLIQVIGRCWHSRNTGCSWQYCISYLYQGDSIESHISPGHQEQCSEDELRRL